MKKFQFFYPAMSLGLISILAVSAESGSENDVISTKDGLKVLYVTHEPGKYHDYTPQREIFEEIAKRNGWNLTVMSGSFDEVEDKLASNENFGVGSDVIVYNVCMAHSDRLEAPHNIITHTKEKGIPSLLIHGSLHSFWPTYKAGKNDLASRVCPVGANEKVQAKKGLVAEWKKSHPGVEFPAWPNMTGIASVKHGPRKPVEAIALDESHPIFDGLKGYTTHEQAELYNNYITAKDSPKTTVLMKGKQGKDQAAILWEHPVGKSKSVSFTLGHSVAEWQQEPFQKLLTNSVNYLGSSK
ncbi:ThuA domain-containing protein [Rubritalea spongiae]|uniref:ThuA domain-containing protein n=1 Tax=Rubritalea spongiae TaxID=430797 RepID=A0ABW5E9U2_9BACT